MARFFMAGTNLLKGPTAVIRGRDAEHIQVLRIRPGEDARQVSSRAVLLP